MKEIAKNLLALKEKSTQVNGWYPHSVGSNGSSGATVRGPFNRWFTVSGPGDERYEKHVAYDMDDAEYCAAAMNEAPKLAARVLALEAALERAKNVFKCVADHDEYWVKNCNEFVRDALISIEEDLKND
jgi:hypothetical protein